MAVDVPPFKAVRLRGDHRSSRLSFLDREHRLTAGRLFKALAAGHPVGAAGGGDLRDRGVIVAVTTLRPGSG